jgi:tetratricopeptide (TPR) repeat protein
MKQLCLITSLLFLLCFTSVTRVKAQTVKEKADALIAGCMRNLGKPDSLNYYADKLIDVSRTGQYLTGEGWGLKLKGIADNADGNYQEAIAWYQQGLKIFTDLGNELEVAKANLNIGIAYQKLNDLKSALTYGEKALYSFEKLKDPNGIGRVLNVLGIILMAQENYPAARNYFAQYNAYARQANATVEIANSYNSLGTVYTKLNKLDSAIYCLNSAAKINETIGNKLALGQNYQNIGVIYLENKKDYRRALDYYTRAKTLYTETKSKGYLSQSLVNIGQAYKNLLDTTRAKTYFRDALLLANQVGEKEVITQAYNSLSLMNVRKNDYKEAYDNYQRSVNTRDSVRNMEMIARMQDLNVKYDSYKKQQQIIELKQQAELHRLQIRERNLYLLIGAVVVIFGVVVAVFVANRRKLNERARREFEKNQQQELMTRETVNYPTWSINAQHFLADNKKTIRVVPGNEFIWFDDESVAGFFSAPFTIGLQSNRMGYQLEGQVVNRINTKELLSTAVTPGTIQVTGNGSLIILMADCQTMGGYPRIAQVAAVDLPVCGQFKPGDRIYFEAIDRREAEKLYIEQELKLQQLSTAIQCKL